MTYQNMLSRKRPDSYENLRNDWDTPKKFFSDTEQATTDLTPSNSSVKTIRREANENPYIRDAIAIDIGTSKCRISICKDRYIQIVEHESNRSVPSYVALSEQNEWFVGRMAENYAVCLQNVIYDIRWLLTKTNDQVRKAECEKQYFFKRMHSYGNGLATFDMIEPNRSGPLIVNANEIFEILLYTLFTTAYKNLQYPTTIAITVPIKSEQNYKTSVEDCVKRVSSSTAAQNIEIIDEPIAVAAAYAPRLNLHSKGNAALVFCMGAGYLQVAAYFIQQRKADYWTDLIIAQISGIEPIVVNFAGDDIDRLIFDEMMKRLTRQNGGQKPTLSKRAERRLKIACEKMKCALSFAPHTRIDVDSLYRSGDEDCDLVEVIQKDELVKYYRDKVDQIIEEVGKVYKGIKPKFILLAGGSTRIPLVTERLKSVFNGSTICNFLNVDEVAANGAAAIVSRTATVAEKSIDYEEVIRTIKEQEEEEEEQLNPPPMPTPVAMVAPIDNTRIPPIPNKRHAGDGQYPSEVIQDHQYNPAKELTIQDSHTSQGNRPEQPNIPFSPLQQSQPVSSIGSCSSDSRDKGYRSEKLGPDVADDMQNKEAKASENIRRSSSSRRSHKKDSTNYQSERQSDITNARTFENINFPHTDVYYLKKPYDETTFPNLDKAPKPPGPNYYRNVKSLSSSDGYTSREAERADPMRFQIPEQHGQSLSRIADQMKHREELPDIFNNRPQSQSLRNNPHNYPQPHTYPPSSIEIGPNSRNQERMLTNSMTKNNKSGRRRHNSTSSNSMNRYLCGCRIL